MTRAIVGKQMMLKFFPLAMRKLPSPSILNSWLLAAFHFAAVLGLIAVVRKGVQTWMVAPLARPDSINSNICCAFVMVWGFAAKTRN